MNVNALLAGPGNRVHANRLVTSSNVAKMKFAPQNLFHAFVRMDSQGKMASAPQKWQRKKFLLTAELIQAGFE